jgi:hypothetical protein
VEDLTRVGRGRKKVGVRFNCFVPRFRPDRKRANFSIRTKRNIMINSVDTRTNKDSKYHIFSTEAALWWLEGFEKVGDEDGGRAHSGGVGYRGDAVVR